MVYKNSLKTTMVQKKSAQRFLLRYEGFLIVLQDIVVVNKI